MKKILLFAFLGTLFATGNAFAHCGACGSDAEGHDHKPAMKECCKEGEGCCKAKSECKKCCKSECKKECSAKKEKAEETAATAPSACCPAKAAKAA